MFTVGIIFHYPQQILRIEGESLFSVVGLAHYAVERILFLIPITFAGMYFGMKVGLVSLGVALAIILPRVVMTSEYLTEAIMETGTVFILGILINLWFGTRKKENELYRQLINRLEESEQEMSISEQKYRYLFENASDAIWVQDVNGLFVDGNRAFETLTGFTVDELKGVQLAKFLSPESLNLAREIT